MNEYESATLETVVDEQVMHWFLGSNICLYEHDQHHATSFLVGLPDTFIMLHLLLMM